MPNKVLQEEQYGLEMYAYERGAARYRDRDAETKDASNRSAEKTLIGELLSAVEFGIEKAQTQVIESESCKGINKWGPLIMCLPVDKLALISLRMCFNYTHQKTSTIASAIASTVKMERELEVLRETHPVVYKLLRERRSRWDRHAHTRAKKMADVVDVEWEANRKMWLGMKLLQIVIEYTDVFYLYRAKGGYKKTVYKLSMSDEYRKRLEQDRSNLELYRPYYLPMIIKPLDWIDGDYTSGGYLYCRESIVKRSFHIRNDPELKHHSMPRVLEAVNWLQSRPMRINKEILSVASYLWEKCDDIPELFPQHYDDPYPPIPDNFSDQPREVRQAWVNTRNKVRRHNSEQESLRVLLYNQMYIGNKMSKYDNIYFPYQLDWRSRLYPMTGHVTPQSDDLGKSMLLSGKTQKLTDDGFNWMLVHLANCFGHDKISIPDRREWAYKNLPEIVDSARDPVGYRFWTEADKPWQFLAACCEWHRARDTGRTSLVVSQDGSCNGLQHLSALARDKICGAATNLIPGDVPADIYSQVAERARQIIKETYLCSDQAKILPESADRGLTLENLMSIATTWKDKLNRSHVKRAVMTTPYGLTQHGMKDQFVQDKIVETYVEAVFLRDVVDQALASTIGSARKIMTWLQECVSIVSREQLPLRWVTPIGFLVRHEYVKGHIRQIETALQKLTVIEQREDAEVHHRRQVLGIVPNLVHSFDASHLMQTALRCRDEKVDTFVPVHDSFGVLPNDVDTLNRVLREEFVNIYKEDWITKLHRGWQLETGLTLPDPPNPGALDITEVMNSRYMFH